MAWACALATTLYAERAPLGPAELVQESELILVGRILSLNVSTERSHVERGFGNYDWAVDLTLKIESIEKGQYSQPGTISVRCFRVKSRKSNWGYFSVSGNHPIPDVDARVRAYLYRQGGLWRVVFPNGLAPVSDRLPLVDAAAIRTLSRNQTFTYGWPVELWICLAVVVVVLLLILAIIKRLRRFHPAKHGDAFPQGKVS